MQRFRLRAQFHSTPSLRVRKGCLAGMEVPRGKQPLGPFLRGCFSFGCCTIEVDVPRRVVPVTIARRVLAG